MKIYIFIIISMLPLIMEAQEIFQREKRDNIWIFGSGGLNEVIWSNAILDFNEDITEIYHDFLGNRLDFTNASICDTAGNLLLYTNGISIANANHDTLENGGRVNPRAVKF